jgi:hypothetical protein
MNLSTPILDIINNQWMLLNEIIYNNKLIRKILHDIIKIIDFLDIIINQLIDKKYPIEINCNNLRVERQNYNDQLIIKGINMNDIQFIIQNCNKKKLNKLLILLNMSHVELMIKCNDKNFTILLSQLISINSSRQGSKDESYILKICNQTSHKYGITIQNLPNNAHRPCNNGKIINIDEYKNMKKHDCLKSFDARISGKINGWIFAKMTFGSGGHQDNVFDETHILCDWVVKHEYNDLLFVILIDTNLVKQLNELKNRYDKKNLLIVNHIELQQYFIDNFNLISFD